MPRSNLGITAPSKNAIINGDFRINQRGSASYAFASSVKTLDRWSFVSGGGGGTAATGSVSQQSFTVGQTSVPGEPQNFIRVTNTSQGTSLGVTSYHCLAQGIEDVRSFAGQTVTISFWARSTITSKTLGVELYQNFGSGGSTAVSAGGSTRTLSTTWQQFTVTVSVPSISGKTIGTSSYLGLFFWFQSGSSLSTRAGGTFTWQGTGDIEIANVQLEQGSVATSLEYRSLATELQMCQRYFETVTGYFSAYGSTGVQYYWTLPYRQIKRVTPTITTSTSNPLSTTFSNCGTLIGNTDTQSFAFAVSCIATGSFSFGASGTADAEFTL